MEGDSSVEKLRKRLYQYGAPPKERERRPLHDSAHQVQTGWVTQEDVAEDRAAPLGSLESFEQIAQDVAPEEQVPAYLRKARGSGVKADIREKQRTTQRVIRSMFVVALVFFLISAGVAGYVLLFGGNQISCDKMDIDVTGPLSVPSGKELVLSVGVLNKNPTPVHDAELIVKYPAGTRSAENTAVTLGTTRDRIGTVEAGERVRVDTKSLLYGQEKTEYTIDIAVEYHVDDSSAVFVCEAPYQVIIATAPVALTVDGLEEVSSGQELALTVTVTSNSDEVVKDQRLVADYPFGFEFVRADPEPTDGTHAWDIGDVAPGMSRTFTIYGVAHAPTVESRSIKFRVGERDPEDGGKTLSALQLVEHSFLISRPFLALNLAVNDNLDPEVPVNMGEVIEATLNWENTLPYTLYDVEIEAKLDSPHIDSRSVRQGNGYYRSVDRTILWTGQTTNVLKEVRPDQSGRLEFNFVTYPLSHDTSARDPNITISFTVRARRLSDNTEVSQTLVAQSERIIKFNSQLMFAVEGLHALGPFTNTGVHPPAVDYETTYTVHWKLLNNTSDVDSVKVVGELPINVRWLNNISPSDGSLNYNPNTHEVIWNPGLVPAGTGSMKPVREVYFQIGVTPSVTDPFDLTIVGNQKMTGTDRYTGVPVEITPRDLYITHIPRE